MNLFLGEDDNFRPKKYYVLVAGNFGFNGESRSGRWVKIESVEKTDEDSWLISAGNLRLRVTSDSDLSLWFSRGTYAGQTSATWDETKAWFNVS